MEGETSWESLSISHHGSEVADIEPVSEGNDEGEELTVSLDSILPNDILERILSFLPIASIIRAASVCKRWYDIIHSKRFLWANKLPQKPWYYMFTYSESPAGYAYDPILRKWYSFDLPCIEKSNWFISSSCGYVCSMDNDSRSRIFVFNPITKDWKMLLEPPGAKFPDYSTLAVSVDRKSHDYTVVVAKSKQVPGDFLQWDFSIHIYESESRSWITSIKEVLTGWRGGDESVICNGVLYCLIHSTGVLGTADLRHGLIVYDLSAQSSHTSLMRTFVPVPCSLTCGRLMNLKERLVMVGGIAKYDRPDIIKGIGIWELHKNRGVGHCPVALPPRVVKEVMRLHPPAPMLLPHRAVEAGVELGGYAVPEGARVLVNLWAMGRDEEVWAEPEAFAPERFLGKEVDFRGRDFELIPFGSGRRACPGLPLAARTLHLLLASLLRAFDWSLPEGMGPADMDLSEKFGATLPMASSLWAVAVPAV